VACAGLPAAHTATRGSTRARWGTPGAMVPAGRKAAVGPVCRSVGPHQARWLAVLGGEPSAPYRPIAHGDDQADLGAGPDAHPEEVVNTAASPISMNRSSTRWPPAPEAPAVSVHFPHLHGGRLGHRGALADPDSLDARERGDGNTATTPTIVFTSTVQPRPGSRSRPSPCHSPTSRWSAWTSWRPREPRCSPPPAARAAHADPNASPWRWSTPRPRRSR
jgi:hypothetical protein